MRSGKHNEILSVSRGYQLWGPIYKKGNAITFIERKHTKKRISQLDIKNKNIIDIGCGIGEYALLLAKYSKSVVGIDQSPYMLKYANSTCENVKNVKYLCESSDKISVIDNHSMNCAFCTLVIDHLSRNKLFETFKHVYRILNPFGWFYITDVDFTFLHHNQPFARFIDKEGLERKIRVFPHSQVEVIKLLQKVGFEKITTQDVYANNGDVNRYPELSNVIGKRLIVEYFANKK